MKIVFLGTPEISATCLLAILKSKHEVLAVVTQPDKPVGRGAKIQISAVKEVALNHGLPIYQFSSISKQGVEIIKNLKPDALVLVAFGQILSAEILDIALPINLHGSLLPALRGPSPIQSAILEGLTESGVSVMVMEPSVDTGKVILQKTLPISSTETSGTLFPKMAKIAAEALVEALDLIENKTAVFASQNHSLATYTTHLTKESAQLDFNENTEKIINKIRAYNPSPTAFFTLQNKRIKVFEAQIYQGITPRRAYQNGEVVFAHPKTGLVVKTADGFIIFNTLQAPNGKILNAKDFLNGIKISENTILNI